MDEKKSPVCLTGFVFSLLSPIVCFGGLFLYFLHGSVRLFGGSHNKLIFFNCVIVFGIVFLVLGLILSVIGIKSLKNGYSGKKIAVIGIVISVLMIITYFIGAALVWYENTNREYPPTSTTSYTENVS